MVQADLSKNGIDFQAGHDIILYKAPLRAKSLTEAVFLRIEMSE